MCGIFGQTIGNNDAEIKKAIECFKYRGPDDTGVWSNTSVTFANVRLSIIDPAAKSNQPMFDRDKKIGIVFNGEIYNYKEIKKELSEFDFQTNSDTEVIIYAYKKWGKKCFERFYGMFAVCIYDMDNNQIILARDHVGIKPLYYYFDEKSKNLTFSSEVKGILSLYKKNIFPVNYGQIANLFTTGFIASPNTLYENIFKLEPSTILTYSFTENKFNLEKFQIQTNLNNDLEFVLENSINRHLVADVPVGLFFSGGTDSTVIACLLEKMKIRMNAYSIVMPHKSVDDKYIDLIAKKLNLNLHKFTFDTEEFDSIYQDVMTKIDEPLYDASIFPTYFVSQKAKQDVKVVLSGEGGDEYFLGYDRHLSMLPLESKKDSKLSLLDYLYLLSPNFKGKKKFFAKLFLIARKPVSYFLLVMSIRNSVVGWKNFKEKNSNTNPMDLDKKVYLENDLLRKIDFATSYSSLEGRVPLLDPEVIAFSNNLKNSEKIVDGVLKYPLKKFLESYLPQEYIYREKSGFSSPLSYFFATSKFLKNDLENALQFFQTNHPQIFLNIGKLYIPKAVKVNPYFCFTIISLYYTLKNN